MSAYCYLSQVFKISLLVVQLLSSALYIHRLALSTTGSVVCGCSPQLGTLLVRWKYWPFGGESKRKRLATSVSFLSTQRHGM